MTKAACMVITFKSQILMTAMANLQLCSYGWPQLWGLLGGRERLAHRVCKHPRLPEACHWERMCVNNMCSLVTVIWRMTEYCTPNKSLWHKDHFELKALWETAGTERAGWSPFSFLKAGPKTPMWKMVSLYRKERSVLITRDEESRLTEYCTDRHCQNMF